MIPHCFDMLKSQIAAMCKLPNQMFTSVRIELADVGNVNGLVVQLNVEFDSRSCRTFTWLPEGITSPILGYILIRYAEWLNNKNRHIVLDQQGIALGTMAERLHAKLDNIDQEAVNFFDGAIDGTSYESYSWYTDEDNQGRHTIATGHRWLDQCICRPHVNFTSRFLLNELRVFPVPINEMDEWTGEYGPGIQVRVYLHDKCYTVYVQCDLIDYNSNRVCDQLVSHEVEHMIRQRFDHIQSMWDEAIILRLPSLNTACDAPKSVVVSIKD